MDLKTIVLLESKRENDRTYTLMLPAGAALGECYDVLHEFMSKILELAQESSDRAIKQKPMGDNHA